MQLASHMSKAPSIPVPNNPVKDRLALSALCNNSSENPLHLSYSSRETSPSASRFSNNQSSSSISSLTRSNPSPPSFLEPPDAPDFTPNHRLPPISDLKLFSQIQRPSLETLVPGNSPHSDAIPIPIRSTIPRRVTCHETHSPTRNIERRKPYMTSAQLPYKLHSNAPSFPSSPPALPHSSRTESGLTNSALPQMKPSTFTHYRWSSANDSPLSRSHSPSLSASPPELSYTRRRYPSQSTTRVCTNCGVSQTRQWVRGENHAWLCHSCGQFWRKNGYSRPRALWNRPTFKRSSRKSKLTSHGIDDTKRTKGATRQTVSSSFLDGKKMIQLETCLPNLHRGPVAHKVVNVRDGLTTR